MVSFSPDGQIRVHDTNMCADNPTTQQISRHARFLFRFELQQIDTGLSPKLEQRLHARTDFSSFDFALIPAMIAINTMETITQATHPANMAA